MASPLLSRMVVNSLKAIFGEAYTIHTFDKFPSRRNEVYKITGSLPDQPKPTIVVAKLFKQAGIAHETSLLREAHHHNLFVPRILGTTADVLVLEYINAPNLCDLITLKPDIMWGKMLASWLAHYHTVFSRGNNQVILKGDARIRNFLVQHDHLVAVDFEESRVGSYFEDLAVACGSVLDTIPLFTEAKLKLCGALLDQYGECRQISNLQLMKSSTSQHVIQVLKETANRRGNPPKLLNHIKRFEKRPTSFPFKRGV